MSRSVASSSLSSWRTAPSSSLGGFTAVVVVVAAAAVVTVVTVVPTSRVAIIPNRRLLHYAISLLFLVSGPGVCTVRVDGGWWVVGCSVHSRRLQSILMY